MSAPPVVFRADPGELGAAVARIRQSVRGLAESRLYQLALVLTVLMRGGRATAWHSWDAPPPATALRIGRADYVGAMWTLFGTAADAVLSPGAAVRTALRDPSQVIVDVLYKPSDAPTVVSDVAGPDRRNSVKLPLDDAAWLWAPPGGSAHIPRPAEYNPVNTLNQQNGVGCALPARTAVSLAPGHPADVYAVRRNDCPHRQEAGRQPTCALNGRDCGGSGDDDAGARQATKPRLLAPPVDGVDGVLVLPDSIKTLVAQARRDGASLPRAIDLSLLMSWCHTHGRGPFDHSRLLALLGHEGIDLLTSRA